MDILCIVLAVVLFLIGTAGFFFGLKNGGRTMREAIENNFRYVTIGDLEKMAADMRAKGAGDDSIMVLVKPDWWEEE